MRDDIFQILNAYSDKELAFFAHYRLSTYSAATRDILGEYLASRKITYQFIERTVKEYNFHKSNLRGLCPRCGTNHTYVRHQEIQKGGNLAMYQSESYRTDLEKVEIKMCEVCGFDLVHGKRPSKFDTFIKNLKQGLNLNRK